MEESSTLIIDLLPREILFEILLRLPVKSLCRFRCVSPLWRSVINDPHFVSSHLIRSSADPKLLICMDDRHGTTGMPTGKFFFTMDYPKSPGHLGQVAKYHGRIDTTGYYVSQSHGLICIDAEEGIRLCNPTTGECVNFPKPSARSTLSFLGYDPVEKKHKIVNSLSSSNDESGTEIHILALGEKEWRRIDPSVANLRLRDSLCIDGVMHMVGATPNWDKAYLMLFDVGLESFQAIPFPAEYKNLGFMCLMEVGGRVALVDYSSLFFMDIDGEIKLWILEDFQEQVWSCKGFIPPPHYVVGVTHAHEVVFAPIESMELPYLYLYRINDACLRKLEICGLSEQAPQCRSNGLPRICYHVESLQSLRDFRID